MKAYKVTVKGFDPTITWAKNAKQAKYLNWKGATRAGFDVEFGDLTVVRAEEFDNHPQAEPLAYKGLDYLSA